MLYELAREFSSLPGAGLLQYISVRGVLAILTAFLLSLWLGRLLIDRLFDADADALVMVCGDLNAGLHEIPARIVRGDEEDMGNGALASRVLVPLERSLPADRRFTVRHRGRPEMVDHLLASRALLAWYRTSEIHNEPLGDEVLTPAAVHGAPESFHAPMVAEFRLPEGPNSDEDNP